MRVIVVILALCALPAIVEGTAKMRKLRAVIATDPPKGSTATPPVAVGPNQPCTYKPSATGPAKNGFCWVAKTCQSKKGKMYPSTTAQTKTGKCPTGQMCCVDFVQPAPTKPPVTTPPVTPPTTPTPTPPVPVPVQPPTPTPPVPVPVQPPVVPTPPAPVQPSTPAPAQPPAPTNGGGGSGGKPPTATPPAPTSGGGGGTQGGATAPKPPVVYKDPCEKYVADKEMGPYACTSCFRSPGKDGSYCSYSMKTGRCFGNHVRYDYFEGKEYENLLKGPLAEYLYDCDKAPRKWQV